MNKQMGWECEEMLEHNIDGLVNHDLTLRDYF